MPARPLVIAIAEQITNVRANAIKAGFGNVDLSCNSRNEQTVQVPVTKVSSQLSAYGLQTTIERIRGSWFDTGPRWLGRAWPKAIMNKTCWRVEFA
jgi:hypothetical protein